MSSFAAVYFDGRSARANPVTAEFDADGGLRLVGENGFELHVPRGQVRVAARLGDSPRHIFLADAGHCETGDNDAVDAALARMGSSRGSAWLHRLESSWRVVLVGMVVVSVTGWAAVRYGLPAAAKKIAYSLPIEVNEQIGREALATLDKFMFDPSELPEARQAELQAQFRAFLEKTGDTYPYRIAFRAADGMGANAVAFPSGDIVLTDDLVEMAEDDRELVAVLAHECGHIQGRHGLRTVLQNSAVVLLFAMISGDISGVTALGGTLPTLLLESKFSREFEEEADAHAAESLARAGLDPAYLADMLQRLESSHKLDLGETTTKILDYVGSHPPTPERIKKIRGTD